MKERQIGRSRFLETHEQFSESVEPGVSNLNNPSSCFAPLFDLIVEVTNKTQRDSPKYRFSQTLRRNYLGLSELRKSAFSLLGRQKVSPLKNVEGRVFAYVPILGVLQG